MAGFDVDTAPYATLGGRDANPLGMLAAGVSIQRGLNENQLFQQTFAARKAMGPLAQASIDPETGQMNYNKFAMLISSHPETAWMAPDIINKLVERQLTQAHIVNAHLDAEAKKRDVINGAIGGLVVKGDDVGPTDLMHALTSQEMTEFVPPQQAAALVASAPKKGPQLTQWIQQHAVQNAQAAEALKFVKGQYHEMVDANGNKQSVFVSPLTSTASQVMMGGAGGAGAPSAGFPAPGSPDTVGGAAGAPSATPPAPARPMTTELGPMRQEMLRDTAKYGEDVANRAQTAQGLKTLMAQVKDYLPHFQQGGGQEFRARLSQLAQAAGLDQQFIDTYINQGNLGDKQAAIKMFFGIGSQIAAQLIHSSGGRLTQTEWAQTLNRGSPNIDLDPRAIKNIMGSMDELTNYTLLENKHFGELKRMPGYDMTNARRDWADTYDQLLAARTRH
jgi:hypothetical protein